MKRLTAEETVARLRSIAAEWSGHNGPMAKGYRASAEIVERNLIQLWQDEPIEGPCWVCGVDAVCSVYHWNDDEQDGDGGWSIEYIVTRDDGSSEMRWEPLNGRKVCPIGARPQ